MRLLLLSLLLIVTDQALANTIRPCRCQPDEPCWPSEAQWASLNSSIDGNLRSVKPLGYPCHAPNYNATECMLIKSNMHNSTYRSSQLGAVQHENWGAWPTKGEQCYVETPTSEPCAQGRISLYSAVVKTASHIQAVVRFAAKFNIKLVIKNTGHDFLGRSSAPNSLQLFTHNMKDITVVPNFMPTVPDGVTPPPGVNAVTIAPGVQLHEMYKYLGARNLMVVAGSANTVGFAGGYVQGGGHSLLGWLHGMASDNVLEFQVVPADGSLVYANAYQNTDLFFALRGGGGGTFGVVVSVTTRAHPDYPVTMARLNYTRPVGDDRFWDGVEAMHRHILGLNDVGGTGFYYVTPRSEVSTGQYESVCKLDMMFVNQTDISATRRLFSYILADIQTATGTVPSFEVTAFPSLSNWQSVYFTGNDTTGMLVQLGSRLVSRDFFRKEDSPAKVTKAISKLRSDPGDYTQGIIMAGGQVARNKHIVSGLNPGWRDALVHLLFVRRWNTSTTAKEQVELSISITNHEVPILNDLERGRMGAYMNEADANEPNFQESFWGHNYERLYAVKQHSDPDGLFIVRKGVGSEDWNDDGICRIWPT
ncbi:hypothetical protein ATEIFO6365_0012018600 [Aspergillus terreus]|uniref:Uncharacterized protein n=1 Tax=Aspergillus terreus TaxID=33178 RepID=A0A5M3ZE90_ASPTE|nr:hypothetical protein ATETN484_0013019600 [Aspergillus terreus]GFF20430.1 hypothetical protein ATEIFO6365_0012018600 [Aspergillus terreus]